MQRCHWCNLNNPLYVKYHDEEWGVLRTDEEYLFEMLVLESFQAGLSWECVLNKREAFREAFKGFKPKVVASFTEDDVVRLLSNEGIIRHRKKIESAISNAKVFLAIQKEFQTFYEYLKTYTGGIIRYENDRTHSYLSDELAKDLKKRGMKFVGTTIVYSYLQAIGVINSHEDGCFRR